jgi:hypothetical protein
MSSPLYSSIDRRKQSLSVKGLSKKPMMTCGGGLHQVRSLLARGYEDNGQVRTNGPHPSTQLEAVDALHPNVRAAIVAETY